MYPITSPLTDGFEDITAKIAHDTVCSWTVEELTNFAVNAYAKKELSSLSIEELVEVYEDLYKQSIVHEIDLPDNPVVWNVFVSAEYCAVIETLAGAIEISHDISPEDNVLCWAIRLRNPDGLYKQILNISDENEAIEIVNSINCYYYSGNSNI